LDSNSLRELLEAVRRGEMDIEGAVDRLAELPFIETANSRIDTHRALRQGIPEVIYGGEKSAEQIVEAARALRQVEQDVLVTRVEADKAARVLGQLPEADYDALSRLVWIGPREPAIQGKGTVLVISAGSADLTRGS